MKHCGISRRGAVPATAGIAGLFFLIGLVLAAGTALGSVLFQEVGAEVGFDAHIYQGPSKHSLGVNWIDVNEDGWADLFVVDGFGGIPHLYLNNGDGSFSDGAGYLPDLPDYDMSGSIFADYDNDGDSDIYIYTDNEQFELNGVNLLDGPPNLLLKNLWMENGGVLTPGVPLFDEVAAAAGVDDLAEIPLGAYPGHRSKAATWLDYDRDGCVDLYVGSMVFQASGNPANRDRLYRNRCDGTFEDVTDDSGLYTVEGDESPQYRPTLAVVAGHFDNDRWPDLYVAHASPGAGDADFPEAHVDQIFKNRSGIFGEMDFEGVGDDAQAAMGVDFADIDRDGDWDFYLSDMFTHGHELETGQPGNPFYLNTDGRALLENSADIAAVQGGDSWGVNFFDADQDGYEDLLVATFNRAQGLSYLYRNAGDGTFEDVSSEAGLATADGRGSACADYDNDGDVDVVVVNEGGVLQLFRNETTDAGHWIQIELHGTSSNADAIGAVVTVRSALEEVVELQRRQIKGGSSAHSQDSVVTHFGLGDADLVDYKVEWPSGDITRVFGVAADQRYVVVEGEAAQ